MSEKSNNVAMWIFGVLCCFFFFLLILVWYSWVLIPSGHVGVVTTFGAVEPWTLSEGFNWKAPWRSVYKISVQTLEAKEEADVPTKEGLSVHLEVSLLYSLKKDSAAEVFQSIGPKFVDVIVTPQFRSALRGATVNYEAKDLYTSHRAEIEEGLHKTINKMLESRGIRCEAVLLRAIKLPDAVKHAIEKKLATEQEAQQMEFTILKERREAERKTVEAKGIADAQKIIQGTLSDAYLRYLWIESLKVAASKNATTIYIPTGADGMPFFKEASK